MSKVIEFPSDPIRHVKSDALWATHDIDEKSRLLFEAAKAEVDTALALFAAGRIHRQDVCDLILDYAPILSRDQAPRGHR